MLNGISFQVELLLYVISAMLAIGLTGAGLFAKQLFSRLDSMNTTDDEQWRAIRSHERELGAHEALLRASPHVAPGGD